MVSPPCSGVLPAGTYQNAESGFVKGGKAPPSPAELPVGPAGNKRLNQWLATGIGGNDITFSCLYVSATAAVFAGLLASVVPLMVMGAMYLYRRIGRKACVFHPGPGWRMLFFRFAGKDTARRQAPGTASNPAHRQVTLLSAKS